MASAIKKAFSSKPSYAGDRNAEFLAEACRKATAKDCYEPDQNLKGLICTKINDGDPTSAVPIKITYDILRRRLNMENPHKQWLAVDLVRQVLNQCGERIRQYTPQLLMDVGKVAVKPNKRGSAQAQVYARRAAIDLLHSRGDEGINVMRMVRAEGIAAHYGPGNMAGYTTTPALPAPQQGATGRDGAPTPAATQQELLTQVRELIDTANSHSTLLQDLLLAASSGQSKNPGDINPLVSELCAEITQLKDQQFPPLLARLSENNTPEAEALMNKALECTDVMDACLALRTEVADAARAGPQGGDEGDAEEQEEAGATEGGADGGAGEEEGEAAAAEAPAQSGPADLLSFDTGRLQSGQEGAAAAVKEPSADPFGLSDLAMGFGAASAAPAAAAAAAPAEAAPDPESRAPAGDDPFMGESNERGADAAAAPPVPAGDGPNATSASAGSNPFGGNAFPSPTTPAPSQGQQPFGQPGPYGPPSYTAGVTGFPYQQPYGAPQTGYQYGPAQYGAPPTGQYGAPPNVQYGVPPTGQYGAPPTGQYGAPPTGQYGAPPTGQYGAPFAYGGAGGGYGNASATTSQVGSSFSSLQPPSAPPGGNPFAASGAGAGFSSSATGMPAPGYNPQPMANPFAAPSATGAPAWNPNGHKDAFNDLLAVHSRVTTPSAPMKEPMRKAGGTADGGAAAAAHPFGAGAFDAPPPAANATGS